MNRHGERIWEVQNKAKLQCVQGEEPRGYKYGPHRWGIGI